MIEDPSPVRLCPIFQVFKFFKWAFLLSFDYCNAAGRDKDVIDTNLDDINIVCVLYTIYRILDRYKYGIQGNL